MVMDDVLVRPILSGGWTGPKGKVLLGNESETMAIYICL